MTIKDTKKSLVVFLAIFGLFSGANAFATSYSYETPVQFNFNSEIHIEIDSADIEILDLAPGTSADSNVIGLSINTNNVAGYTASATVGNSTYNTTSMVLNGGTGSFVSLSTDASVSSLTTDNTWGYATSTDNGTSWSNFSGLPLYTDNAKEMASTNSPADDTIKFKINAKAATSQSAGDYKNVINFTVVANVPPRDFPDVVSPDIPKDPETGDPIVQEIDYKTCALVEAYDTEYMVTDSRDHKRYTISKLRDDKCWMTQNLDLDLVAGKTYTTADTDLGWDGRKYTSASWTVPHTTIDTVDVESGKYENWVVSSSEPYSVNPGDWYWIGNWMRNGVSTWYDGWDWYEYQRGRGGDKFSRDPYEGNGRHGHVGNYYNWAAAIASNNADQYNTSDTFVQSSICPVGWKLPRITTYQEKTLGENDFYNLRWKYVGHDQNNDDKEYTASPLWFVRSGYVDSYGSLYTPGVTAYYWSDTVSSSSKAYSTFVNNVQTSVLASFNKSNGNSVRCVIRTPEKYIVNYDVNNGDGWIAPQRIAYGSSAKLYANQFIRNGYIFTGWNTKANGTGVGYADEDVFYVDQDITGDSITLYAQWELDSGQSYTGRSLQAAYEQAYVNNPGQFPKDGGGTKHGLYVPHKNAQGQYDGTYFEATQQSDYDGIPANDLRFAIQDISLEVDGQNVCERTTIIGSEAYVLDLRDFKSYHIVKAKDGRCWVQDNLALDLTDTSIRSKINSTTTNATDQALSYLFNGGGSRANGTATGGVVNWPADDVSYFVPHIKKGYEQTVNTYDQLEVGRKWKFGIYYNYCAASAGTYCYDSFDGPDKPNTAVDIENDICPAGWRIPTGRDYDATDRPDGGEYKNLYDSFASSGLTQSDDFRGMLHTPYSGYMEFNGLTAYNNIGYFWSSTQAGYSAYILTVQLNNDNTTGQISRPRGAAVRCINKN